MELLLIALTIINLIIAAVFVHTCDYGKAVFNFGVFLYCLMILLKIS